MLQFTRVNAQGQLEFDVENSAVVAVGVPMLVKVIAV